MVFKKIGGNIRFLLQTEILIKFFLSLFLTFSFIFIFCTRIFSYFHFIFGKIQVGKLLEYFWNFFPIFSFAVGIFSIVFGLHIECMVNVHWKMNE